MLQYTHSAVNSGNPCRLIPAPFVNISREQHRAESGEVLGYTYTITLEGKTLPYKGNPSPEGVWNVSSSWISSESSADDPVSNLSPDAGFYEPKYMEALLKKEKAIREAFSNDGGLLEIISPGEAPGNDNTLKVRPKIVSIDFAGGQYVGPNDYTITMEADYVYGLGDSSGEQNDGAKFNIRDASESWSIEEDEEFFWLTDTLEMSSGERTVAYRVTREISAIGKPVFVTDKIQGDFFDKTYDSEAGGFNTSVGGAAWQQARGYVLDLANNSSVAGFVQTGGGLINSPELKDIRSNKPSSEKEPTLPSHQSNNYYDGKAAFNPIDAGGVFNINGQKFEEDEEWKIYNYVRTQNVDEKGGSFSVSENFIISNASRVLDSPFVKGAPATENIDVSIDESLDNSSMITVSVNGTINGLQSSFPESGVYRVNNKYENALAYFNHINDNAKMKTRVLNLSGIDEADVGKINPIPTSKSITKSPENGSISYNFAYDNRMDPCLSGAVSETIDVNDTLPGNIVAITPTIGRSKGPVLQYLGSNTESKRSLSINAVFNVDRTLSTLPMDNANYSSDNHNIFCSGLRPNASHLSAARDVANMIKPDASTNTVYSTSENQSWNGRTGSYTYNIEWVYEED